MSTINNSATVNYTLDSLLLANSQTTSNTLSLTFDDTAGLTITKTANPTTFAAGDIITYTVNITNSSGEALNGVRIIDNLGNNNLAYVLSSATLTYNSQSYPVTPIATNPLTFTLQQLPVSGSMTLTYKAQVIFNLPTNVSLITNALTGIGYTATGTVNGFANETIQKKTSADFSVNKSASESTLGPNQAFNYYITLTNNTANEATVSSITDQLPANYTLISVKVKIGSGTETTLSSSDYELSGQDLTIPSGSGPSITVPAEGTTLVTLTGYFS